MKNIFINKKVWKEFSDVEMENYITDVFNHYRTEGFPLFPTESDWRNKELNKLVKYDYKKCVNEEEKVIRQTMHGLSLCWSYHPHHYDIQCNKMRTVTDTFKDDDLLRNVIIKRTKMGDNMSDSGLRKMIKIFSGTQCVSNFRPTAAAAIYHRFCPVGGRVYDMSSGFGGRALGAHIAGVNYTGVDPSTKSFNGVSAMIDDIGINAKIYKQGSEERTPIDTESIDLAFTSPPYFDCEKYSDEGTQSYKKYDTKNSWMNGFMRDTILECERVLKEGSNMIINIASVKSYPDIVDDTINMAISLGFVHEDTWKLALSALGAGGHKYEPILIFRKGKKKKMVSDNVTIRPNIFDILNS